MSKATMFLNQISVVDHAYINDEGVVVGGSFNPDFIVSGEIDPVEQVVIDFSTVKKDIKHYIDHKESGFDHKLWFIVGYSKGSIEERIDYKGSPYFRIKTPAFDADVPVNAVKIFTATEYSLESIGQAFTDYLQVTMQTKYPTIQIECNNTTIAHINNSVRSANNGILPTVVSEPSYFTYVHGLKDSTSWGCQNNSHGHLSFLQLEPVNTKTILFQQQIANILDGVVFLKEENIVSHIGNWIGIDYTTERGRFVARYDTSKIKVVVLQTETTIEHLVAHIADTFKDVFEEFGVSRIYMSEGLSKGAVIDFHDKTA
jgi:6-pyruvoyl-tetrahydropterin synthase